MKAEPIIFHTLLAIWLAACIFACVMGWRATDAALAHIDDAIAHYDRALATFETTP